MKTGTAEPTFQIFAPMLKSSLGPDGKMRLHGIASSTVKDRHGDTMTLSALSDMERSAQNNLTIFLNHEYRVPEDVAGSVERALIRSHPQDADVHDLVLDIIVNESNERAVKAWEAIQSGTQLGLSIGAMIPDGGATRDRKSGAYTIDHVELLETSLVGVPANPRSWVEYAVKSLNATAELDAEDLEHTEDPNEDLDEAAEEEEVEVEKSVETADAEPELCEECGLEVDECKCNSGKRRRKDADDTTTNNSAEFTVTTENPDISDATVSITTPYADISIDTGNRGKPASDGGSSQEAQASVPENEDEEETESDPWAAIGLSGEPETDEVETELPDLEPTVLASMKSSRDLLAAMTSELIETKEALRTAVAERDAAIEAASKVVTETAEILEKLAATPVGRRAVYREATEQFGTLKQVYGEAFVALLKKG